MLSLSRFDSCSLDIQYEQFTNGKNQGVYMVVVGFFVVADTPN
jgi:hypothetical protein